jgi:hypothetical protein
MSLINIHFPFTEIQCILSNFPRSRSTKTQTVPSLFPYWLAIPLHVTAVPFAWETYYLILIRKNCLQIKFQSIASEMPNRNSIKPVEMSLIKKKKGSESIKKYASILPCQTGWPKLTQWYLHRSHTSKFRPIKKLPKYLHRRRGG